MNLIESIIAVSLLTWITCTCPPAFVRICMRAKQDFLKCQQAVNDFSLAQEHECLGET